MATITTRALIAADRPWAMALLRERRGGTVLVSRGVAHDAGRLPAIVAAAEGRSLGLATYRPVDGACKLVSLDSTDEGRGVGAALIAAVAAAARTTGCRRLWPITTNDNAPALRFYQRRGFALVAIHRNAIAASRRLKPAIPLLGLDGIPIRDEIELEMLL